MSTIQNQIYEAETEDYHFENPPDQPFLERLNFDYVRAEYFTIRKILSAEELDYIDDQFFTRHVSGTTRIEGNTLEYNDVLKILKLEKSPDTSSPLRDIHEVENYIVVKDYLKKPSKISINEYTIKTIHKYLMNGLTVVKMAGKRKQVPAGVYRNNNALLSNIPFKISPPELIEQRIQYLLAEYRDQVKRKVHPVEIAAIFHQDLKRYTPLQMETVEQVEKFSILCLYKMDIHPFI